MSDPSAYESYRSGLALLECGDHHAAVVALMRAREVEPDAAMVRESLGRALFRCAPLPRGGNRVPSCR